MRAVLGHGLLPGLRPVRLHFGFAAERERHDRKRIQDEEGFLITTRPPKRGRSILKKKEDVARKVLGNFPAYFGVILDSLLA